MRRSISDIIPSGKRSIRDIPIPVRKIEKTRAAEMREEAPARNAPEEEPQPRPRKKIRKAWIVAPVAILLLAFAVLSLVSGATLAYEPKTLEVSFDDDVYTAKQAASAGELPYSVVKLSSERSAQVPATGEETVAVKASGRVVIYNEQSTAQTLVKTTRLETPDGKIYRIPDDITIPAKGSIEVIAAADAAGAAYNIGLSDFTLPGLKGSARFEQVYGRSRTAMSGGFTGTRKKVSEEDLAAAKSSIEDAIEEDLMAQARAQVPADFVIFPDLTVTVFEELPTENIGDTNVKVTERGNFSAVIFRKSEFEDYISGKKLSGTGKVEITDYSDLSVGFFGGAPADLPSSDTVRVELSGSVKASQVTDEPALASDLIGLPKDSLDAVLAKYPSINSASVTIRPFWKRVFPSDASEINIVRRD